MVLRAMDFRTGRRGLCLINILNPHRDGIAAVAVYDEFYNPERSQQ
jgi:hypothetical protein